MQAGVLSVSHGHISHLFFDTLNKRAIYNVFGMIVRSSCPSGRFHLTLPSFFIVHWSIISFHDFVSLADTLKQ